MQIPFYVRHVIGNCEKFVLFHNYYEDKVYKNQINKPVNLH